MGTCCERVPATNVDAPKQSAGEMPCAFVDIRILEDHSRERKNEVARRVNETVSEMAELPREGVWVVLKDVRPPDWYASGIPVNMPRR
jgi:4-oxalocrotonate tautomerase